METQYRHQMALFDKDRVVNYPLATLVETGSTQGNTTYLLSPELMPLEPHVNQNITMLPVTPQMNRLYNNLTQLQAQKTTDLTVYANQIAQLNQTYHLHQAKALYIQYNELLNNITRLTAMLKAVPQNDEEIRLYQVHQAHLIQYVGQERTYRPHIVNSGIPQIVQYLQQAQYRQALTNQELARISSLINEQKIR